jgi:transcriptional regulator with XRE-family HTH domain
VSIQSIGNLIQSKRQAKNLAPIHLALEMGITATMISSWEKSKTVPNVWQMKLVAQILGFDAKEFEAHTGKAMPHTP